MIPKEWIEAANQKIGGFITQTPITYDQQLDLYIKWENQQVTGSFKIRGALNRILNLSSQERASGLVTCSAGNHGQGVALAARHVEARCIVYASDHATPVKLEAMSNLGADVRLVKGDYVEAERAAITFARKTGMTFISPYNDALVIAGQGTLGLEIREWMQTKGIACSLLLPVGGGGLMAGVASYIKTLTQNTQVIGVQSQASSYAHHLFYYGNQEGVVETESIAEGLAGEIDHASITIPLLLECADDIQLVSEAEIKQAIRYAWFTNNQKIEGSAAVGLAARLAGKINLSPVLTIITGGNIQPELFNTIIRRK